MPGIVLFFGLRYVSCILGTVGRPLFGLVTVQSLLGDWINKNARQHWLTHSHDSFALRWCLTDRRHCPWLHTRSYQKSYYLLCIHLRRLEGEMHIFFFSLFDCIDNYNWSSYNTNLSLFRFMVPIRCNKVTPSPEWQLPNTYYVQSCVHFGSAQICRAVQSLIFFDVLVMYVTKIFLRVLHEKFITDKSFLTFSSTFLHTLSQYNYNLHVISCHFPAISETLRNLQTMDILII